MHQSMVPLLALPSSVENLLTSHRGCKKYKPPSRSKIGMILSLLIGSIASAALTLFQ